MTQKVDHSALWMYVPNVDGVGVPTYFVPTFSGDGVEVAKREAAAGEWSPGGGATEMLIAAWGASVEADIEDVFSAHINEIPEEGLDFSDSASLRISVTNLSATSVLVRLNIPAGALPSAVIDGEDCVSVVTSGGIDEAKTIVGGGGWTFTVPLAGSLHVPQKTGNYANPPIGIEIQIPPGQLTIDGVASSGQIECVWPVTTWDP